MIPDGDAVDRRVIERHHIVAAAQPPIELLGRRNQVRSVGCVGNSFDQRVDGRVTDTRQIAAARGVSRLG